MLLALRTPTLNTWTVTQPEVVWTVRLADSGTAAVPVAGVSLADTSPALTVACNRVDPAAALPAGESAPAWPECAPWPLAAEERVPPVRWLAASQAEPARAKPTTVAITHMPMCRRPDRGPGGLRCRVAVLV